MRARLKFLVLFFILVVIIFGCASRNVEVRVQADPTPEGVIDIPPPPPRHAPGTAHVSAECVGVVEHDNSFTCTLRITTIYGYGSSTPHISKDETIKTSLSKALLQSADKNPTDILAPGNTLRMRIRSLRPRMADTEGPDWQIIAVE